MLAPVVIQVVGWFSIPGWLQWPVLVIVVIWGGIDIDLIPRRVRAIGYFERDDDLLIRKGPRLVAAGGGRSLRPPAVRGHRGRPARCANSASAQFS